MASLATANDEERFRFHALIPLIVVFLITTHATVALRFFTRIKFAKLWWDDWLMAITLLFFSVYCSTAIGMFVQSRGARGVWQIPHHNMETAIQLLIVSECFYILTMIGLKLSLAVFFLRILKMQWQRWLIIAAVSISTAFGVAYFFFTIFQCGFVSNIDQFIGRMVTGNCAAKSTGMGMNYTYAILGTLSDFTCGLVPIFLLKNSNLPRRAKITVCALMAFASIGSIASIVRMVYLDTITVTTDEYFANTSNLAIWSTIEPGIGIIAASAATLRRLFQRFFKEPRLFGTLSRRSSGMPNTINCTTTITQEHTAAPGSEMRLDSNATTLGGTESSTRKGSVAERSMAEEMRAYGMTDFEECASVTEQDLEAHTQAVKADRRKVKIYGEQHKALRVDGFAPWLEQRRQSYSLEDEVNGSSEHRRTSGQ